MTDYWRHSGYHLLRADPATGRLTVTDAFLRAYLDRPELRPQADSCAAERALHARLCAAPRGAVAAGEAEALADPDAAENWRFFLAFRDALLATDSIEDGYLALVSGAAAQVPPLLVDQLVQLCLRHILGEACTPLEARAGELLFRAQKIGLHDGAVLAADEETVAVRRSAGGALGPLAAFADKVRATLGSGAAQPGIELDVLQEANAERYWQRDERHDLVLDIGFGRAGLDALCRVLERWTEHFTGARVAIQPVGEISDPRWRWHVGLDAEAMAMLNDLYAGTPLSEDRALRLLALFRLDFADPARMRADVAGRPVYLAMAMDAEARLRLKPQNLPLNLPLASH